MDQINRLLSPLAEPLPPSARSFLEGGGWWLVIGLAGLLALLLLWALVRRLGRFLFGRRRRAEADPEAAWRLDLEDCPLPTNPPGDRRLTVYHLPVRLRLVVMAPAGTEADVDATAVEKHLDHVVPGLREQAEWDRPRVRVWPAQLSRQGFAVAFHRRTRRSEPDGQPSRWILVAGKAQIGQQAVLVGLGLWADEPTTIGRLTLERHQWLDVLRVRRAED